MISVLILTRHSFPNLANGNFITNLAIALESQGYKVEKKSLLNLKGEIEPDNLRHLKEEVVKPNILISFVEEVADVKDEIFVEVIKRARRHAKIIFVLHDSRIYEYNLFKLHGEKISFAFDEENNDVIEKIVSNSILRVEEVAEFVTNKEQKQQQIEKSVASFVEESINQLNEREQRLLRAANRWNVIGFLSLAIGVIIAIIFIVVGVQNFDDWFKLVFLTIKSLIAIALLVATSRYSFNLAKTLMNESVKNSDRIHAISFGKFYLQIFGETVEPSDVKDVFRDWNVANESNFAKLDSSDFDPKLVEAVVRVIEVVKSVEKTDKK